VRIYTSNATYTTRGEITGELTIVCGHYGSGKTNFAINLAIDAARNGKNVTLVDMDVVNPYFTSSEYSEILKKNNVKLISPTFAGTNTDLPALPASMSSVFEMNGDAIIDAGGDDVGATVLGRFADKIAGKKYRMLYVTNMYRPLTSDPKDSAIMLKDIESACRLKATAVVNNSHLKGMTTASVITGSLAYAKEVARLTKIPLLYSTAPRQLIKELPANEYFYPVDVYVRTAWEIEEQIR